MAEERERRGRERRPAGRFRSHLLSALVATTLGTGCASTLFERVEPKTSVQLDSNEALLVMHVDTEVPLSRLMLTGLFIKEPIPVGEHLWIARVRPGHQTWLSIVVGGQGGYGGRYRILKSRYPRSGELEFEIRPGAINYAGELIVRKAGNFGYRRWLSLRVRNHSATALRELESSYAELLDVYPLHFAGTSGDTFLEFYGAERKRVHAERKARPTEEATP